MFYNEYAAQEAMERCAEGDRYNRIRDTYPPRTDKWWEYHRIAQAKYAQAERLLKQ